VNQALFAKERRPDKHTEIEKKNLTLANKQNTSAVGF
jgi:hypothetical protein